MTPKRSVFGWLAGGKPVVVGALALIAAALSSEPTIGSMNPPAAIQCAGTSGPMCAGTWGNGHSPNRNGWHESEGNAVGTERAILVSTEVVVEELGCFQDNPSADPEGTRDRDLNGHAFESDDMTPDLCVAECKSRNFAFAGVQYGRWCFCGDSYGGVGTAPASECGMACAGDGDDTCGGTWRNEVFEILSP